MGDRRNRETRRQGEPCIGHLNPEREIPPMARKKNDTKHPRASYKHIEDRLDVGDARKSLAEAKKNGVIPWEKIKPKEKA
jgi:predicted helicase